jgi:hypothetical protein
VRSIDLDIRRPVSVRAKRGGPVSRRGVMESREASDRDTFLPIAEQRKPARRARRHSRYDEMIALRVGGASVAEIHRAPGLSRKTIMRWTRAGAFPDQLTRLSV